MYSIKLTWIDLMNGNSMDIQQIIRILLQSLTLVTTAHRDWIQFLSLWCLLRNARDWWWHGWMFDGGDWTAELLAVLEQGSLNPWLEVQNKRWWSTFLAILLYSYDNFFYEMIQTGRKTSLAVSNICFIYLLRPFAYSSLTTKLGTCGFLSERQISRNHSRNLVTSYPTIFLPEYW